MVALMFPNFYYPMLDQFQAIHTHLDVMIIEIQVGLAMLGGDLCIISKV